MARVKDTAEAWESRALGADEAYVQVADVSHEIALDEARGIYVQSSDRLDLATIARAFESAPDAVDYSGKPPKAPG